MCLQLLRVHTCLRHVNLKLRKVKKKTRKNSKHTFSASLSCSLSPVKTGRVGGCGAAEGEATECCTSGAGRANSTFSPATRCPSPATPCPSPPMRCLSPATCCLLLSSLEQRMCETRACTSDPIPRGDATTNATGDSRRPINCNEQRVKEVPCFS
jgi:hypothetical protein